MIICPKHICGVENLDTAKYCISCGTCLVDERSINAAELRANHSEHKNSKKAKFCIHCGKRLIIEPPPPPPEKHESEKWKTIIVALQDYPYTGCIYKGAVKDGKPHGEGIIIYNDGDWHDGNFVEGKENGKGVFYSTENKRKDSGEYKGGVRFGKGKIEFEDRVYEGEWNSKGANGRGVYIYTDGDKQEGFFVDGTFTRGKWSYENGDYDEGSFDEDGLLHGIGSQLSGSLLYFGEYSHGDCIGKGKIESLKTGTVLEGFWGYHGVILEGTIKTKKGKEFPFFELEYLYKDLHKYLTQEHTAEELDTVVTRIIKKTNIDNKETILNDNNLIKACVEYLYNEAPPDEQNVFMIAELINSGFKLKGQEENESDLDRLFSLLEEKDENHIALKYYIDFFDAASEQGNSIFEICRKRFSCIGSRDNIFQFAGDKDDAEMLANVIIHSFGEDTDSDDTEKLKAYLVELYEKSIKTKRAVKYTDLNIAMIEVEKLKSFWESCS